MFGDDEKEVVRVGRAEAARNCLLNVIARVDFVLVNPESHRIVRRQFVLEHSYKRLVFAGMADKDRRLGKSSANGFSKLRIVDIMPYEILAQKNFRESLCQEICALDVYASVDGFLKLCWEVTK